MSRPPANAMAHKPTPAQQAAIDQRSKTLLVSAAAGAGKTTTLTQRIIASLLDEAHPADLSRMLVITFTRASAADLKDHIAQALTEAAAQRPWDRRLAEQTVALSSAAICTVDSFFFRLLREHAAEAGVSPDVRVADTAEQSLLLGDLCERLMVECYDGKAPQICSADEFCELAECLTSARYEQAGLGKILLDFLDACRSFPNGAKDAARPVEKMKEEADLPVAETVFGRYLTARVKDAADHALSLLSVSAAQAMDESEKNRAGVQRAWDSDRALLENLQNACRRGYTAMREALEAFLGGAASLRAKEAGLPDLEQYREDRAAERTRFKARLRPLFAFSEADWPQALRRTADLCLLICRFTCELEARYEAEKQRRRICDYTDLERKLYHLLYTDGRPNSTAASVADGFDYVYVDEYQDIDRMQHAIIEAVSRRDNRFMVGDVKQSIYSFRRADPEVFSEMRRAFPPLDEAEGSEVASLHLSENFRSVGAVIDFIDEIFDLLFGVGGKSIGYEQKDRLICGRGVQGEDIPHPVLVELPVPETTAGEDGNEGGEPARTADGDPVPDPRAVQAEANYVAREIARLLSLVDEQGQPKYKPADIAVLLRSVKRKADPYVTALRAQGLAVEISDEKDFFLVPEVLLALCLLNAVDNPRRDIYLAGAMQSPLYGFDQSDLTRIRMADDPEHTLWESVQLYAQNHPQDEKTARLLSDLAHWRTLSEGIPTDRLIRRMYDETGLLSTAGKGGSGRENLLLLYQYARQFEGASFKGLHAFIDYINQVIKTNNTLEKPKNPSADPQKIQLMTIHASKGLEYKVCFVCGTLSPFRHPSEPLCFDPRMGMALPLCGNGGLARVVTPLWQILRDARRRAENEEEMRVFYVALTRAKERLYVTAALRADRAGRVLAAADRLRRAPHADALFDVENSFTLMAAALSPGRIEEVAATAGGEAAPTAAETDVPAPDPALYEELDRRFSFSYPYEDLRHIPGKLSVSRLSPAVLDGTAEEVPLVCLTQDPDRPPLRPAFCREADKATPADRGTATHLFLQFCDFARLRAEGVAAELQRLTDRHFLSKEDAALVRTNELERFRASSLLQEVLSASQVWREFRFHVRLPAADFTQDPPLKERLKGEWVLVQGVIDCLFRDGAGQLCLLDYKTDRLSPAERADLSLAAKTLISRHALQLGYYAQAVARIFGRFPDRVGIYSLPAGRLFLADAADLATRAAPTFDTEK